MEEVRPQGRRLGCGMLSGWVLEGRTAGEQLGSGWAPQRHASDWQPAGGNLALG